ncbi:hypothetical protein FA13DRAFT_390184 [Coprinellus micaceus]|uniref:Uncharacterized protein n=1 Tax=Coprinellus micaceus TaxID=71717 RepID=A0A4Y7TYH5_COPMI|nr:hypothetical protein FA13DRAFT_390184 [Coprinellus micaceus]
MSRPSRPLRPCTYYPWACSKHDDLFLGLTAPIFLGRVSSGLWYQLAWPCELRRLIGLLVGNRKPEPLRNYEKNVAEPTANV